MKSFIRVCNSLMTHTGLQTIKIGALLIPAYSIVWLALRFTSMFLKEH